MGQLVEHEGHEIELDDQGRCTNCRRPMPKVRSDSPVGPKRSRLTITEPPGEDGELERLLIDVVDRVRERWPDQLGPVGDDFWRYKSLHFVLYSISTANEETLALLMPSEVGG